MWGRTRTTLPTEFCEVSSRGSFISWRSMLASSSLSSLDSRLSRPMEGTALGRDLASLLKHYAALSPSSPTLIPSPPFPSAQDLSTPAVQQWIVDHLLAVDQTQQDGARAWKKAFWSRVVKGIEVGFEQRRAEGDEAVEDEVSAPQGSYWNGADCIVSGARLTRIPGRKCTPTCSKPWSTIFPRQLPLRPEQPRASLVASTITDRSTDPSMRGAASLRERKAD